MMCDEEKGESWGQIDGDRACGMCMTVERMRVKDEMIQAAKELGKKTGMDVNVE